MRRLPSETSRSSWDMYVGTYHFSNCMNYMGVDPQLGSLRHIFGSEPLRDCPLQTHLDLLKPFASATTLMPFSNSIALLTGWVLILWFLVYCNGIIYIHTVYLTLYTVSLPQYRNTGRELWCFIWNCKQIMVLTWRCWFHKTHRWRMQLQTKHNPENKASSKRVARFNFGDSNVSISLNIPINFFLKRPESPKHGGLVAAAVINVEKQ